MRTRAACEHPAMAGAPTQPSQSWREQLCHPHVLGRVRAERGPAHEKREFTHARIQAACDCDELSGTKHLPVGERSCFCRTICLVPTASSNWRREEDVPRTMGTIRLHVEGPCTDQRMADFARCRPGSGMPDSAGAGSSTGPDTHMARKRLSQLRSGCVEPRHPRS
jgi:hypothetical protein